MPTHKQTIEALYGAEKKWEQVRARRAVDHGAANCPLCELYGIDCGGISGDECPIMEDSGFDCQGTPWHEWHRYCRYRVGHRGTRKVFDEKSFDLANEMLQYIRKVIKKWEGLHDQNTRRPTRQAARSHDGA